MVTIAGSVDVQVINIKLNLQYLHAVSNIIAAFLWFFAPIGCNSSENCIENGIGTTYRYFHFVHQLVPQFYKFLCIKNGRKKQVERLRQFTIDAITF